jgi:hypothetical protein
MARAGIPNFFHFRENLTVNNYFVAHTFVICDKIKINEIYLS